MKDSPYTQEGLEQLARIIRASRGELSQEKFGDKVGVTHATISRLEQAAVPSPEVSTFIKLAEHTPYTFTELIAIALGMSEDETVVRQYRTAEDAWLVVEMLPRSEAGRLIQKLTDKWMIIGEET